MKNNKKIFSIFSLLALLVACGGGETVSENKASSENGYISENSSSSESSIFSEDNYSSEEIVSSEDVVISSDEIISNVESSSEEIKSSEDIIISSNEIISSTESSEEQIESSENISSSEVQNKKELVDVVLFVGQSNMVGRDTNKYDADIPSGMAYEYKRGTDSLVELVNPVGESYLDGVWGNKTKTGIVETSTGSNMVPAFAKSYVETTNRKIVAVHVARGGRPISYFEPNGEIYPVMIEKFNSAVSLIESMDDYEIGNKFYVMYQGESNTNGSTDMSGYKTSYMNFHNALKEYCDIDFGAMLYTGRDMTEHYDQIISLSNMKKTIAEENDDIIICNKETGLMYRANPEYMLSDNVHVNKDGMEKVGKDSAVNITNYLGYGDVSLKGVDPVTYLKEATSYKVTLTNGTFGDSSTAEVEFGSKLPEITFDGDLSGAYVKDDQGNVYMLSDYIMPNRSVTLTIYESEPFILNGYGKLNVGYASDNNNGYTRTNSYSNYVSGQKLSWANENVLIGNEEEGYDVAAVLNMENIVVAETSSESTGTNANFRLMTAYNRKSNTDYLYLYTFKNLGSESLDFDVYKRNSGSDTAESTPVDKHNVKLESGETKTVVIDWFNKAGNNNDLTYFKFNKEVGKGSLAITNYVLAPGSLTKYSATITGGASFASGNKMDVAVDSSLPAVTYDDASITSDSYNLGWIVTDEEGNKSFVYTKDFKMPAKNITLTPYNTVKFILSKENTVSGVLDTWSKDILHKTDTGHYASNEFLNTSNMTISLSGEAVFEGNRPGGLININAKENGVCRSFHAYWSDSNIVNKYVTYTFKNYSDTDTASFTLAQMSKSGTDITGMPQQDVVLAPGESITFTLENNLRSNGNLIWTMKYNQAFNGSLYYAARVDATIPNA